MSVLFKKSYWNFLLKSTNSHGVHSPFVYDLVCQCFYKKSDKAPSYTSLNTNNQFRAKHICILNNFFVYFDINKIAFKSKNTHSLEPILFPTIHVDYVTDKDAELIYISSTTDIDINTLRPSTDAILIIETPYTNVSLWNALKKQNFAHVIVDTYYFGFIFNRKQQAKEEFYIRI